MDKQLEEVAQGVPVQEQLKLRNKKLNSILNEIYKMFSENEITYIEWLKMLQDINSTLKWYSTFKLPSDK